MLLFCIALTRLPQIYAIQFAGATLFSKALFSVDKMHMHVFIRLRTFKKWSEKLNKHSYTYRCIGIWVCLYTFYYDLTSKTSRLVQWKKKAQHKHRIFSSALFDFWRNYTDLCNIVILVRSLQKRVCKS